MADSGWSNTGESDAPALPPLERKIKRPGVPFAVICESIGDFSPFETVVPLEDRYLVEYLEEPPPPTAPVVETEMDALGHVDSDFVRNVKESGQPEMAKINFDVQYRGEHPDVQEPVEEEATVSWTRKDNSLLSRCLSAVDDSESDVEDDVKAYLDELDKKKKDGWVTDEKIAFDESMGVIRNIHASSISVTSYGQPDHRDFGNAEALDPILSSEDKIMIGFPKPIPGSSKGTYQPGPKLKKKLSESRDLMGVNRDKQYRQLSNDEVPDQPEDKPFQVWSDYTFNKRSNASEAEVTKYLNATSRERPPSAFADDTCNQEFKPTEPDMMETIEAQLRELLLPKANSLVPKPLKKKKNKQSKPVEPLPSADPNFSAEKGDYVEPMGTVDQNSSSMDKKPVVDPKPPLGSPPEGDKWIPPHLRPSNCASNTVGDARGDNSSEWVWDDVARKFKDI